MIVELTSKGKVYVFHFSLVALSKIKADYNLQDLGKNYLSFVIDYSFSALLRASKKKKNKHLPSDFTKDDFEDWFEEEEGNEEADNVKALTDAVNKSLQDLGKKMAPKQKEDQEPEPEPATKTD
ncbi:hypothetical protein [Chondrinema litorale]|uniref:hypothetical protein n=1 Tax=Chondrinema litorale TaxID=2994555 RepID=UPI002542CDDB|nr:hypothetical protein [Chondrinema litorale]UZS00268.1 hypothetical protein OQ292_40720 [Chondrinema litorale]